MSIKTMLLHLNRLHYILDFQGLQFQALECLISVYFRVSFYHAKHRSLAIVLYKRSN